MSILDIAQQRKGKLRDGYSVNKAGASMEETRVEYGTAQADSVDGFVEIMVDNSDESFEVACDAPISSGDRVAYISTNGNGKAVSVSTLSDMAEEVATIVREFSGGVLVAKVGQSYGALVNANGSFDVVELTWNDDVFTIGDTIATFGQTVSITPYQYTMADPLKITISESAFTVKGDTSGNEYFSVEYDSTNVAHVNIMGNKAVFLNEQDPRTGALSIADGTTISPVANMEVVPVTYTTGSTAVGSGGNFTISKSSIQSVSTCHFEPIGILGVGSTHGQNWYLGLFYINANGGITCSYKHAFGSAAEKCTFTFYVLTTNNSF